MRRAWPEINQKAAQGHNIIEPCNPLGLARRRATRVKPDLIAWATRLVLTNDLYFDSMQTVHGEVRLLTISTTDNPEKARPVELGILFEDRDILQLIALEEVPAASRKDSRQT